MLKSKSMAVARTGVPLALALFAAAALTATPSMAQFGPPPGSVRPPLKPDWNGKVYPTSWALFQAMKADAAARKSTAALPDWTGTWTRAFDGAMLAFGAHQPSNPAMAADSGYGLPSGAKLTPEYKARWDKKVAEVIADIEWDPLSACLPAGYPRSLTEPFLREFIVRPEETWSIIEVESEVRRIYTDGRGHVPDDEAYPLWTGDSIGFWDGDTLVVHTNSLRAGQYQRGQPDHSEQITTVERIRKIGPTAINDDVYVYDPPALTEPWHVTFNYKKVEPAQRINMWSCSENNNVVKTSTGGTDFVLPGEAGYKDPSSLGTAPPK